MSKSVAVVGAGPMGLMALKNLTEEGFRVTSFEKRAYVGGLWTPSSDSSISVTEHTIFNSSRFMSPISDFPFLPHHDDFPKASQLVEYINHYVDHFNLRKHVQLNTEVTSARWIDQKWEVKTLTQDSKTAVDHFDKLLVCTGSFHNANTPVYDGIDLFQGKILHSINFPHPSTFKGEKVLIVGMHATSQDITVELASHASKVFISHRDGVLLVSILSSSNDRANSRLQLGRYDEQGRTFDQLMTLNFFLKIFMFMTRNFPTQFQRFLDYMLLKLSKKAYPNQPKEWNLLPAPSMAVTTPIIADEIYPLLESGFATPVPAIKAITGPNQVTLTNGNVIEVDTIIYCTGYAFDVPPIFSPEFHPYPVRNKEPFLYRNMFPLHPDPAVQNSLAFIGHHAFAFPGFVQFELCAMAISQVWAGKSKLPPLDEMKQWYHKNLEQRQNLKKQYNHEALYPGFVDCDDAIHWLDETAGTGMYENTSWTSWRAWQFWWQDRKFYNLVTGGLMTPTAWRLFDMGKRKAWPGAKEQIVKDNEFAKMRAEMKLKKMKEQKKTK